MINIIPVTTYPSTHRGSSEELLKGAVRDLPREVTATARRSTKLGNKIDINRFERLIESLQRALGGGLVSLVVFGSRARGEGSEGSDWDIFLLAEELPAHPFERQVFLRGAVPRELPFQVSLYAKTVKEFERDSPAVYLDIATDGMVFFDKGYYAQGKLQKIRDMIKDAGLKRVRKFEALCWVW